MTVCYIHYVQNPCRYTARHNPAVTTCRVIFSIYNTAERRYPSVYTNIAVASAAAFSKQTLSPDKNLSHSRASVEIVIIFYKYPVCPLRVPRTVSSGRNEIIKHKTRVYRDPFLSSRRECVFRVPTAYTLPCSNLDGYEILFQTQNDIKNT